MFPAEVFAVWASLTTFGSMLQGTVLLVWECNDGARFSLTPGSTTNQTAAIIIHQIWVLLSDLDVLPWVARVPSASNPADAPSRLNFDLAKRLGWRRVEPKHPPHSVAAQSATELALQLRRSG